jgi:hypothetical protein
MIKSVIAAAAAAPLFAGAAFAGPYVNVEANSGFAGSDYTGTTTDFHVGFEGTAGDSVGWYIQGGPSVISTDGAGSETKFSAKTGGSVAATENLGIYGEISFVEGTTNSYGTKAGLKYSF